MTERRKLIRVDLISNQIHYLLQVLINGKKAKLIVDSGATISYITPEFARANKLKVTSGGDMELRSATEGKVEKLGLVDLEEPLLTVGGQKVGFKAIRVFGLDHILKTYKDSNQNRNKPDGLLGTDILSHFNSQINFNNETISFSKPTRSNLVLIS